MLMHTPTRWARPKLVRPPGFILPCQPVLAAKVRRGSPSPPLHVAYGKRAELFAGSSGRTAGRWPRERMPSP